MKAQSKLSLALNGNHNQIEMNHLQVLLFIITFHLAWFKMYSSVEKKTHTMKAQPKAVLKNQSS